TNYPCRLRFKLEGFGITIQNKNDFYVQPFYLNPGELVTFSGSDLEPYFNPKNLVFQGLDLNSFSRSGGKLPEGVYRISVEVLDYYQRSVVSNAGSTVLSVFLSYPPIINSPLQNSKVQALEPQNVIFQWVPRHTGSINAAYNVAYNFRLVELIPADRDPNDAIRSTRPLFETVTDQTILLYGPAEPALTAGNSYAVQVQAVEADGKDVFANNGNSEVVRFTYGDKCDLPLNVLAQLNDPNSLKFTWDALPLQQAFIIRYREADKQTAEWFEQETYTPQYIAQGLRPGKTYEYQVKAQCMNGYGDYTQIQQFQMPDEKLSQGDFVCGKQSESAKPDKKQLLDVLLSGNVFTAGDFGVTVTSVTASQNGRFSGTGTITVPVLANLQFNVLFNKISINSKYQLVDGVVKVGVQGLETVQQGNGLKELSAALSGLSSAFDDLLKELRKDKPDPKVLAQKSETISSQMGSLPKTGNESLQKGVDNLSTQTGNYATPTVWAGLDDPSIKEAMIADVIKTKENAKELSKQAAEVEKETPSPIIIYVNGYWNKSIPLAGPDYFKDYWDDDFIEKSKTFNNVSKNYFINGANTMLSSGSSRYKEGKQFAESHFDNKQSDFYKKVIQVIQDKDGKFVKPLYFVSHSMGAAFSEGIISVLHQKGISIAKVFHFSPADVSGFTATLPDVTVEIDIYPDPVLAYKNFDDAFFIKNIKYFGIVNNPKGITDIYGHEYTKKEAKVWDWAEDILNTKMTMEHNPLWKSDHFNPVSPHKTIFNHLMINGKRYKYDVEHQYYIYY
ncbi:MAG: fibronectin type III domain-containing protein, partial [Daejeonella sp.]